MGWWNTCVSQWYTGNLVCIAHGHRNLVWGAWQFSNIQVSTRKMFYAYDCSDQNFLWMQKKREKKKKEMVF